MFQVLRNANKVELTAVSSLDQSAEGWFFQHACRDKT